MRPATAPTAPPTTVPVIASTDHPCVHPGDQQGLTVRGQPGSTIIYDTVYSNNTDELTTHYGTGSGHGVAGASGVFHTTWVLALNVPPGPATINVGATDGPTLVEVHAHFTIRPIGTPC